MSGRESAGSDKTIEHPAQDKVCVSIPKITARITAFKPKRLTILRNPFRRNSGRTGPLVEGRTAVSQAVPAHSAKTTSTRRSTRPQENLPEPRGRQEPPRLLRSAHSVSSPTSLDAVSRGRHRRGVWRPSFLCPPQPPAGCPGARSKTGACGMLSWASRLSPLWLFPRSTGRGSPCLWLTFADLDLTCFQCKQRTVSASRSRRSSGRKKVRCVRLKRFPRTT